MNSLFYGDINTLLSTLLYQQFGDINTVLSTLLYLEISALYQPTIIFGDINTLSEMKKSRKQKIYKDIVEFNTTHQLDTINIYRLLHSTTGK